jgi:transposase InsO family protein
MRELKRKYYDLNYPTAYTSTSALVSALPDISKAGIKEWASTQNNITLFKPARKNFTRRPTVCHDQDSVWISDLCEFRSIKKQNRNYAYLCIIVDCLSRYVWAFPLKRKTPSEMKIGFEKIFKTRKPKLALYTDGGGEYRAELERFLKKHGIEHWTGRNEPKAAQAERAIRTFKSRLYKYFQHHKTQKWIDVYAKIISAMNGSPNRIIGMTPAECNTPDKIKEAFLRTYKTKIGFPSTEADLKEGDQVRLSHLREPFRKRYLETFTDKLYTIEKSKNTENQPIYTVKDTNGETLVGRMYRKEVTPHKK